MLGIGAIIGTGVLVLTGLVAARDAGPAVIFSFMIASDCLWICRHYVMQKLHLHFRFQVVCTHIHMRQLVSLLPHLMGWTLLSVYVVTTAAVAGGWTGYFNNLVSGFGLEISNRAVKDSITRWNGEFTSSSHYISFNLVTIKRYERK
ncbi:hypothetical protein AXF43_27185 [Bacillus paranthracis]|nr:hypothetical protein [Bacillus paranthracis]